MQESLSMSILMLCSGSSNSNFGFNCDKYPANYCVNFYGSEVISAYNFVVGTCALSG